MFHRLFRVGLSALFLLGGPLSAWAHPHVWSEVRAEVTVSAGYIDGLWTVWTFDEVFSQLILADHDTDGDGKISDKENTALKKGYFDNLKSYQYFTHLGLGTKSLVVPVPQKFTASVVKNGQVEYRFFLPLGVRLDAKTPLAVSFYDDSFFVDMVFEKKLPVTLKITDGGKAEVGLRPDKTKTYYGGQVTPTFAFITWKPS